MKRQPLRLTLAVIALALFATPAFAVNKDMVQLQTEVQQLNDAVARLQQSHDKDMGLLIDMVKQTVDSVNKMSSSMSDMQRRVQAVSEAQTSKADQLSGQIQSLNDAIDEIRARLNQIDKNLGNIQSQQQSMSANIQNLTPAAPAATVPGGLAPENAAPGTPLSSLTQPGPGPAPVTRPTVANAPPVKDIYDVALSDFMTAKYDTAALGFKDVIKTNPANDLYAGSAYFYLGEINFKKKQYADAIKNYDSVIEQYPSNNKVPACHLHKADALIALKQTTASERELQALIQRFPNSQEATLARGRLSALGAARR